LSTLTKICVVFLVIAVLLACPVFIKQATTIPHYKDLLEKEARRTTLLAQHLSSEQGVIKGIKAQLDKAQNELAVVRRDKDGQITGLQAELAKSQLALTRAQALAARLQAQADQAEKNAAAAAARTDAIAAVAADLRKTINKLSQDIVVVKDQNSQYQANLRRAEELVRVYKEREADTVQKLETAQALIVKIRQAVPNIDQIVRGEGVAGVDRGGVVVNATILAVSEGIASINAGTAKGVKAGMRLVVYRDDRFVGYLKISEVDAQEAAGIMVDSVLTAQRGDKVTTQQAVRSTTAGG